MEQLWIERDRRTFLAQNKKLVANFRRDTSRFITLSNPNPPRPARPRPPRLRVAAPASPGKQ